MTLTSCSASQNKDSAKNDLSDNLYEYWISCDENYNIDKKEDKKRTVLFFGRIEKGKGIFKQNEKKEMYSIISEDKSNNTIAVMLHFSNGVNRKEKLILSRDFKNCESIIVTPDGFKISTYYIKDSNTND